MGKNKDFKTNVERALGHEPKCIKRRIGFNIAAYRYGQLITDAEKALKEPERITYELQSQLTLAFKFSSNEPDVRAFSKPTRNAIEKCSRKFKKRYAPLLKTTNPSPS